jgi:hypothetical protein
MLFRFFTLCSLIILNSFSASAQDVQGYVRDYTYHASEIDSKVTARQAALQQLQVLVIQESGVNVQATFSQTETLKGDNFTKKAQANYLTSAQSHIKTIVLEEKWDGESFYIKARMELDKEAFKNSLAINSEACSGISTKVSEYLLDYSNPENQTKLIALSKQHGFEGKCNAWQYSVMDKFREHDITNDEYRTHLLESVKAAPDHIKGKLLYSVIRYSTNLRVISENEFNYVIDAIQVMNHEDIRWIIEALIDATSKSLPYGTSEEITKLNEKKQWASMLDWQLSWMYKLASEGKLGKPTSMTLSKILLVALERISIKKESSFYNTYTQYHQHLEDAENIKFHKKLVRYIKRNMNGGATKILDLYIKDVPDNRKVNTAIFKLLMHIEKEGVKVPYFTSALTTLIKSNAKKVAYIINGSKYKHEKKDKWFKQYDLIKEFK